MSKYQNYQITVKSNAGTLAATAEGDVPDGEHVITGYQDEVITTLHAEWRSELGRPVIEAENITGPA